MSDADLSALAGRESPVRRKRGADGAIHTPPQHPMLGLQRTVGNAAVARMVQRQADTAIRRESEGGEAEEQELQAKHDPTIRRAGMEEEEPIQGKHDPTVRRESEAPEEEDEGVQARHDPAIQREDDEGMEAEGEDEEIEARHDRALQRRTDVVPQVGLEGGPVGPELEARIEAKRGSGSGLSDSVRGKMESAMGASFADVRVHRDAESDYLNRSITAKAFTTGNDIFLREDVPDSDTDTLAHELHHVTQQRGMSGGGGGGLRVGSADDRHEHEADAVASAVNSGQPVNRHAETEE